MLSPVGKETLITARKVLYELLSTAEGEFKEHLLGVITQLEEIMKEGKAL